MLPITIVTLLITSNIISRIQAEEQEERKAQLNGMRTPIYKVNSLIEALNVQKRDTLNIAPESYVEQTNHVDESQRDDWLRRVEEIDNYMENLLHPERDGSNFVYGSQTMEFGNTYSGIPDGTIVHGSQTVQSGNTYYSDNPNGTNVYGPILIQANNTYLGKNINAQYGASVTQSGNKYPEHPGKNDIYTGIVVQKDNTYSVNPRNKTSLAIIVNQSNNTYPKLFKSNKDALKPVIHQSGNFYPSSDDSEAGMNRKNNTESQGGSAGQNTSDSQGNSTSIYYDSDSSSHT